MTSGTPQFETRALVVEHVCAEEGLPITHDAACAVATIVDTDSLRELTGAAIRLVAYASLTDQPIDPALAADVLAPLYAAPPGRNTDQELGALTTFDPQGGLDETAALVIGTMPPLMSDRRCPDMNQPPHLLGSETLWCQTCNDYANDCVSAEYKAQCATLRSRLRD